MLPVVLYENCKIKAELVKTVRHFALVAIGKDLPAEHVQYLCLVIGRYDWPGELVNTNWLGLLKVELTIAHVCMAYLGWRLSWTF